MPTLTFQGGPFDGDKVMVHGSALESLIDSVRSMKSTGFMVADPYVFFVESGKGRQVKVQVHGVTDADRSAVYRLDTFAGVPLDLLSFVGWE